MTNNQFFLSRGTTLQGGKYVITNFIASGGFGITYEARHAILDRRVAIKEFFVKDFCNRNGDSTTVSVGTRSREELVAKLKKKFINEAIAISKFDNPNIVRVHDVFEENGTAYYVMDFIDGQSLKDIVKANGALSEAKSLKYIRQIASALAEVHKQNRLHLDVKPSNIMINKDDDAVLIDFGTSKQYDKDGENTSTLIGLTPGYAPLELIDGAVKDLTPATDIYSLAATLLYTLTGKTPPKPTDIAVTGRVEVYNTISDSVAEAIRQSMLINPLNRPQSIGQFIGLLNAPTVTGTSCSEEEGTILSNNSSNEDTLVIVKEQEIETQLNKKSIRDAIEDKAITPRTPKHKKKTVYWLLAIIIAVGIVGLVLKYTVNMPTSLPTTSSPSGADVVNMPTSLPTTSSPAIDDDVKDYLESTDIKESDSNLWNAFINAFIAQLPEEPLFDIVTSMGTITVKLYSGTPRHRYNFEKLALAGYYNGLLFHRVINGFIIQGGDPLTREENDKEKWGTGGPGYTIDAEFIPEYKHKRGALAAARLGDAVNRMKRSSGSQFYLVQDATSCAELDGEYTVFGETLPECLGVIDKIAEVETDKRDCPINNVRIITIKYHNSTDY